MAGWLAGWHGWPGMAGHGWPGMAGHVGFYVSRENSLPILAGVV